MESDALCVSLGHECGMVDRELPETEEGVDPARLSLLHDNLVLGLFAQVDCADVDAGGDLCSKINQSGEYVGAACCLQQM